VDMHRVLNSLVSEFIGGAVGDAALDATACHPQRKTLCVVVPSVSLRVGRASELPTPDHQSFLQKPALLEVREKR
jgi:hypothetical protein